VNEDRHTRILTPHPAEERWFAKSPSRGNSGLPYDLSAMGNDILSTRFLPLRLA